MCLHSPTGSGKCLAPETPVLHYSGEVTEAKDVQAGDALMGPDSRPRRVLSVCSGFGPLYLVVPVKGDPYVVNDAHILTLRMNCDAGGYRKGELVDVSVSDYLEASKTFRHCAKGWRCEVDFPRQKESPVTPYVVGTWLGDGARSDFSFTVSDEDFDSILPALEMEAEAFGLKITVGDERGRCCRVSINGGKRFGGTNSFHAAMRSLGLGREKFIPPCLARGSREVRREVLAGIVDTDGHLSGGCYDLVFKDERLARDIAFVSRSLGLAAYVTPCHKGIKSLRFVGLYYRVSMSGDLDQLPLRVRRKAAPPRKINKDVRSVGITVEEHGDGPYVGWELDGDGRFLLGDFTVTHNTRMAIELMRWSREQDRGGIFYVNRKLLVGQTSERMDEAGLRHGIRAADFDDMYDGTQPFQVASADTERSRVFKTKKWDRHPVYGGVVVVDEAHLQKTKVMEQILGLYREEGARIVLLTATPVEMGKWADELVVGGKLSEWRGCGALVPVYPHTISQPDLSKVKRNVTGEYVIDGEKRRIYTQSIVGEVIESMEALGDGSPVMMYGPGVAESVWLCQQMEKRGHRFAHVDANDTVIDGQRHKLTRALWEDIVGQVKDRSLMGISCRFKLREGVDIPEAGHCILATPIGSVASYLQTVGRVMRSAPGKDKAILQDHGGAYFTHGSPNRDRDWERLWRMKEHAASSENMDAIREGKKKEPIRCANCGMERLTGAVCPSCGEQSEKSVRRIIEESGELKEVEGDIVPRTIRMKRNGTEQRWAQMFWGFRNKKVDRTFAQMEAFYYQEYGYRPERGLPYMPKHELDWKMKVHEVPMADLHGRPNAQTE